MRLRIMLSTLTLIATSAAAAPRADDYAYGIEIMNYSNRPLVELLLPHDLYRSVTRDDLGDVRVFNAAGAAVPHAFCAAPVAATPVVTQVSLPVFDLQAARADERAGASIEVETSAGTQIRVREAGGEANDTGTQTWAHVIDARGVTDDLRSIEFDWTSPDGASQANVRIEASEDLDQWQTVVPSSTLLRAARDGAQLQRKVVPLPERAYHYLRVVRTDGGPALQLAEVIGERVAEPQSIDPVWFNAMALASSQADELLFDAMHAAPVTYARLGLPRDNTSVRIVLYSRSDGEAQWREQWRGEIYSIVSGSERRMSAPAQIPATHDRYWRVVYATSSQALEPPPSLELGYRPARLRFVAQGAGPYTLAFGSRRADPAPAQPCESLLADVGGEDLEQFIGEGAAGTLATLAGDVALKPLPKKTPLRLVILWGVLVAGVAVLIAMALTLLKRVRHE